MRLASLPPDWLSERVTRAVPQMQANIARSFFEENTSPRSKMLRKNVKSEDVDDRMVFDVTDVREREVLKDHWARNQKGIAQAAACLR